MPPGGPAISPRKSHKKNDDLRDHVHDLVKRSTEWIHCMYHSPTATMPVRPVARHAAVGAKKKSSPNSSASVHMVPNSRIAPALLITFGQTNLTRLRDLSGATTPW